MTVLLPDLSEFQPSADMAGIKHANGGAAIIRACYGTSHADHVFDRLRGDAHRAGFTFLGIYQYLVAGQDAAAQARAFCAIAGKLLPHEIPVLDLEEGGGSQAGRAAEWLALVSTALGKRPWLYSGEFFAKGHGLEPIFNGPEVHTWVAAYGHLEPALGHTLWQSTNGQVGANITAWPGAGKCDTSIYHGSLDQLAALTSPQPPPHQPAQPSAPHVVTHITGGHLSLTGLADQHGTTAMRVLHLTSDHFGGFGPGLSAYADGIFRGDIRPAQPMPEGLRLRVPVTG